MLASSFLYAQRERQLPSPPEEAQYSRKFFTQLRSIFGRFRDSDLQRVFDAAQPIQCSELINDPGEWRPVAFFNEKRELGDWYHANFEEVRHDLAVFIFKGVCRGERGPVQLTSKFPVADRIEAYAQGLIGLDEVDVNVNAAVRASFSSQTEAYEFDLPYLFLVKQGDGEFLYSLEAPHLTDRYATDVSDHWGCKSVSAEAVTYQFLICRSTTVPRGRAAAIQQRAAFGASAYYILSDGKEASSSVKLSFGDSDDAKHPIEDVSTPNTEDSPAPKAWETPDADEKLVDVLRDEFRMKFAAAWSGKISGPQVLYDQRIVALDAAKPPSGSNYCVWFPGRISSSLLSKDADAYSITVHDADGQSSTSIFVDMKTTSDGHLGTLQCFFPRTPSATSVDFSRWKSIAGANLVLEVRP